MGVDALQMEDAPPRIVLTPSSVSRPTLILLFAAVTVSCRPRGDASQVAPPPDVALFGVQVNHSTQSGPLLVGTATQLNFSREPSSFTAHQGRFSFPGRTGLMADLQLQAPLLSWNVANGELWGNNGVVGRRPGLELKARSFRFQLQSETYEFAQVTTSTLGDSR